MTTTPHFAAEVTPESECRKSWWEKPFRGIRLLAFGFVLLTGIVATTLLAQNNARFKARDPGPRPNPASPVPSPVPGLNENETALFNESLLRVSELEGSCDTCAQQPPNVPPVDPDPNNPFSPLSLVNSAGMSPVFNADQCFICHSQPTIGGSSPAHSPAEKIARRLGGTNLVPAFELPDGAFREVALSTTRMAHETVACTVCSRSRDAQTRQTARSVNRW